MTRIDMAARIAAIRTEIAEEGHHPGPDSLVNQDLLALCDRVEQLTTALAAIPRHRKSAVSRFCLGCGNRTAWDDCPNEKAHRLLDADQ